MPLSLRPLSLVDLSPYCPTTGLLVSVPVLQLKSPSKNSSLSCLMSDIMCVSLLKNISFVKGSATSLGAYTPIIIICRWFLCISTFIICSSISSQLFMSFLVYSYRNLPFVYSYRNASFCSSFLAYTTKYVDVLFHGLRSFAFLFGLR